MSDTLPPLREVIAAHGLRAKKNLGQNFLLDLHLTARIARAAGPLDAGTIIEVGPGPGGLTRGLLSEGAENLVAIERDDRCLPALAEIAAAYPGRLRVIAEDALSIDYAALGPAPRRIAANLPYNIGTVLLTRWLANPHDFASITVMLQKEVVDRITAPPGGKDYGRLSVLCQWLCETSALFEVHPAAFTPPPKVTSAVLRLEPRAEPLAPAPRTTLERVTAAAFGQRRKMLRAALKPLGGAELCLAAGIDPEARAETIPVEGFCALARALAEN
ncbi:16S rRNA (adenine(1518)-N(6)/adenine(1519)-N(6))-dimethyltransferase RsmA [Oleispirillum naphthae]|uniref:16S rRNA (adenine(1518)-N(6)/adenine(1519)-N(6))- dimethyltransferase RsmA n=1 Tax=Oleispirillum naphthae TaxID=2838853 RepID=UPI003082687F